jgi:hypothetical protein
MDASRFLRLLFAVLVTVGLAVAPLASPVAAGNNASNAMMQMAGMDMSCCPDKQKNDCRDCPLVAICMMSMLQAGPSTSAVVMRQPVRARLHPLDDPMVDGSEHPPPDHPPRSLA